MQPSLFEEHIIPAIPTYPLEDQSCLTFELYRDRVLKGDLVLVPFSNSGVLSIYALYNHSSALYLLIQGGAELLEVEKQGQMSRIDRNFWSYMMCNYPFFTPAVAKNSLFYGYQARFSEKVFNLLLKQKFLCFGIQKQIFQATILDPKKKLSM